MTFIRLTYRAYEHFFSFSSCLVRFFLSLSGYLSISLLRLTLVDKRKRLVSSNSSSFLYTTFFFISLLYLSHEMSTFKPKVSIDALPQDALTLKDDQFYSLVEKLTSSHVSHILKSQFINSMNTFLLCKDILAPILLPASAFDVIRQDVCVQLNQNNNNSYIVHIGITGQIEYLTELFQKKHYQDAKDASKRQSVLSTPTTNLTASVTSPSTTINSNPNISPTVDYQSIIISSIDKWITSQKILNGSNILHLTEGKDYVLKVSPSADTATVICQCGTQVSMRKLTDNTFFLSNLYKHWKTSKRCSVLTSTPSSHSLPIASSSPLNNSDTDNDQNDDQTSSFSSSTPSNTRTTNKRTASSIRSTLITTSAKRRRRR